MNGNPVASKNTGRGAIYSITPLIRQHLFNPPIIPKRMVWTASSIKLFRKCKRKFFWKYMMRLRPRNHDKNLLIGSAFHHTLGEWYRGRRSIMKPILTKYLKPLQDAAKAENSYFDQEDLDKFLVMVNTFTGMMLGYEAMYHQDKATWDIQRKSIEAKFMVDMGDFDFTGKMDLITSITGRPNLILVEHKTASSIKDSYISRLSLDTQIRGYVFGARRDPNINLKVDHVLYDVVKKCKLRRKSNENVSEFNSRVANAYVNDSTDYFYREELAFNDRDLEIFELELRQTHDEFVYIRDQILGSNPRSWTPNDGACDDFFRLCEYHTLCTEGLDRGTQLQYEQGEEMHEELVD